MKKTFSPCWVFWESSCSSSTTSPPLAWAQRMVIMKIMMIMTHQLPFLTIVKIYMKIPKKRYSMTTIIIAWGDHNVIKKKWCKSYVLKLNISPIPRAIMIAIVHMAKTVTCQQRQVLVQRGKDTHKGGRASRKVCPCSPDPRRRWPGEQCGHHS